MQFSRCGLLCILLVLSATESILARKSFGGRTHSYPKSGGLSGGGGHNYPSSGGHGYPSSGGGHGYPPSGGLSGGTHGGGNHGYPSSGGLSGGTNGGGNHGYPSSGGLSGGGTANTHHTSSHGYPANKAVAGNNGPSTTNVHHHYHYSYNPPKQISYTPVGGGAPMHYPVYHGTPPTYVYKYKDSGSKYGTLLTGLALLNLGALAGTAYAVSQSHSHSNQYKPQPGEVCKFGIKKDNGDYEETRIDCQLITSFILQDQAKSPSAANNQTVITTTTVTNVTTVNNPNGMADTPAAPSSETPPVHTLYEMLPNGTLVPVNGTADTPAAPSSETPPVHTLYEMLPNGTLVSVNVTTMAANTTTNATTNDPTSANNMTSSMTVTSTTTNTTTVSALDVKGDPVKVTPGMQCFVMRHTPSSNMRKSVPCDLLQTYAVQSLKRNSAFRAAPTFTVAIAVAILFMY